VIPEFDDFGAKAEGKEDLDEEEDAGINVLKDDLDDDEDQGSRLRGINKC
jgi:hypothetical protein